MGNGTHLYTLLIQYLTLLCKKKKSWFSYTIDTTFLVHHCLSTGPKILTAYPSHVILWLCKSLPTKSHKNILSGTLPEYLLVHYTVIYPGNIYCD